MILFLVMGFIFIHMSFVWVWYRYTNNPSVVDVGWSSGLTFSGLIYLGSQEMTMRTLFLALILVVWGMRLGLYLWFTRVRKKEVDKRYISLSDNWKIAKPLGFFLNFQLQGLLIFIISLPWFFASLVTTNKMSSLDWFALLIAFVAVFLETQADLQLYQFKQKHTGEVCNSGWWSYSRHPNYFFEWLVWCLFSLFAFSVNYGWVSIISPITLYLIMTRLTGPITESGSIESKGKLYTSYQKNTPMFFPYGGKLNNVSFR